MKLTRHCLLLTLLLGLGACASMNGSFDPPKVDLAGLEPMSTESMEPRFLVKLRVVNPNDQAITINGIYYELSAEGHDLFTGASDKQTVIPAYGENIVEVQAATSLFGTIGLFKTLITSSGNRSAINYALYTKLSIAGRMMPLKNTYSGKLDLSGATAAQKGI